MPGSHANARLEAFCDGVFAIAITLLIIDVKLPSPEELRTARDVWQAIGKLGPSMFAFVLSFGIILITWVNHHAAMRLAHKSAPSFIYANGFLLLVVAFLPFPTALLGDFLLSDRAAPAVVLYTADMAALSLAWILIIGSSLRNGLLVNEEAVATARVSRRNGYFAFALYTVCTIVAFRFPLAIAIITSLVWIYWLVYGIRMKEA
jgi:TMEM175 potassium channel family protein